MKLNLNMMYFLSHFLPPSRNQSYYRKRKVCFHPPRWPRGTICSVLSCLCVLYVFLTSKTKQSIHTPPTLSLSAQWGPQWWMWLVALLHTVQTWSSLTAWKTHMHISDITQCLRPHRITSHVHHSIIKGYLCVCGFVCEGKFMYITTLQIQEYGINGQLTRERGRGENRRKVSEKKEERNRNHQKRETTSWQWQKLKLNSCFWMIFFTNI